MSPASDDRPGMPMRFSEQPMPANAPDDPNVVTIRTFVDALAAGDDERALALLDPEVEHQLSGRGPLAGTRRGGAAVMERFQQMRRLTDDTLRIVPQIWLAAGENTHVVGRVRAEARGWSLDSEQALVFQVRGGLIVHLRDYQDDQYASDSFWIAATATGAFLTTTAEADAYWLVGILWLMLATSEQTRGAFTLMEELCPRGSGPPPHWHEQDEIFYLLDGQVTFRAADEEIVAGPGSLVFIPRGTVHSFRVDSETSRLLNAYTPGGFERSVLATGVKAPQRELPPRDLPRTYDPAVLPALFAEIGQHVSDEPDVLREG